MMNFDHPMGFAPLETLTNQAPSGRGKRKRPSSEQHIFVCHMWQHACDSSAIEIRWRVHDQTNDGTKKGGGYAFNGTNKLLEGRSWVVEAPYGIQIVPKHQVLNPHCEKYIDVATDNPGSWAHSQNVCEGQCQLGFASAEGAEASDIVETETEVLTIHAAVCLVAEQIHRNFVAHMQQQQAFQQAFQQQQGDMHVQNFTGMAM